MSKIKIGITEAGDAGLDFGWVNKMDSVDGAVLITKHISGRFQDAIMPFKGKVILHHTMTGWGGTQLEPNVPHPEQQIDALKSLLAAGFPSDHVVVRVDPIIPTPAGIWNAENIINAAYRELHLRRFRVSLIDMYPHVRNRFVAAGQKLPYGDRFSASDEQFAEVNYRLWAFALLGCQFESCAESKLTVADAVGCISQRDLSILGLEMPESVEPAGFQRPGCLCLSCKKELLTHKTQCPHGCLYCYWKDNEPQAPDDQITLF